MTHSMSLIQLIIFLTFKPPFRIEEPIEVKIEKSKIWRNW